ncbi:MAG: aldehyde dehydrogenase family protein, partial [Albidovulum sp.]
MSKPMTKTELVAAIAGEMGSDKKTASSALDAIAAVVARAVAGGGAVTLPGVGKIQCRARPERQVRNPATGETLAGVSPCSPEDYERIIKDSMEAFRTWRMVPAPKRGEVVRLI